MEGNAMGLFSRKEKIPIKEFCINFYDQWIFSSNIGGIDPWKVACEKIHKMITDLDSTFNQVDFSDFSQELRAIRLEVFAVVLSHRINEKLMLEQGESTKHYLEEKNDGNIWKLMGNYNQAIARATVGGYQPGSASARFHITMSNQMRANFFDEWVKVGYDPEVIARVANRIDSLKAWKSGRGNVYLSFELGKHINADDINEEARLAVINVIHGFYLGTLEEVKKFKIL